MFTAFIVKRHEINGKETDGQARIEMSSYAKPLLRDNIFNFSKNQAAIIFFILLMVRLLKLYADE